MFDFSGNTKHKKAANKISKKIQHQIHDAIQVDPEIASAHVASTFTVGYVYGLIRHGFTKLGFQGEDLAEKHFKSVCKKIPGNFYKVMLGQYEKLDHAMKQSKEEDITLYEMGLEAGIYDAVSLSTANENKTSEDKTSKAKESDTKPNKANNLYNYLLKQSLDINATLE